MADPITPEAYLELKLRLIDLGYTEELIWQENVRSPDTAEDFAREAIFVIVNAGMKVQVARPIFERVMAAVTAGRSAGSAFGHQAKCRSIDRLWAERAEWFARFQAARTPEEILAVLEGIGGIGAITKFHLGKNLGLEVCKPDRHLTRLAEREGSTPAALCERLARATGDSKATVDLVLWRAANLGLAPR
jgi:hypothetical protein